MIPRFSAYGIAPRHRSVPVEVGDVTVGGDRPIVVQSMTNTDTADADATVRQVAALAASSRSTVMRTISEPARASAAHWRAVASASAVSVLVIDCTTIGASPPIITPPTTTGIEARREIGELLMTSARVAAVGRKKSNTVA